MSNSANNFNVISGQGTIIEVPQTGDGTFVNPYRPDTNRVPWLLVEKTESNTYVIEVFDDQLAAWIAEGEE